MEEKKSARVFEALEIIGQNEDLRNKFLRLCREVEEHIRLDNRSVRDEITGPIIDALHSKVGILRKSVKPGLIFNYKYTSKISRELAMSPDFEPDHVWEPQTTKLLVHFSNNAGHVIIGGAYFGDQAVIVAKNMQKNGGTCHVFEPNRDLFELLELNGKNNGLNNIRFNNTGLWSDDNSKLILIGEDDTLAHPEAISADKGGHRGIPTISINSYGLKNKIKDVGLIMLDLEGGEYQALKGADRYLSQPEGKAPILVFEVHSRYYDWSRGLENTDIIRFLSDLGYHAFSIRDYQGHVPMGKSPIELIPPERTFLEGPPHGFNMLGIKDMRLIENDLFRICYDVSPKLLMHKDPKLHHPRHR